MVSIITILYLLTGFLGVYAHCIEDVDAVSAAPDLPRQQIISTLGPCDNGTKYDDKYECVRRELIVNAASVVTRLTQYPRPWDARCGCDCQEGCPPACCHWETLAISVNKDLEEIICLWDQLGRPRDDQPSPDHQHSWQEA
jgi:hypothetical protein